MKRKRFPQQESGRWKQRLLTGTTFLDPGCSENLLWGLLHLFSEVSQLPAEVQQPQLRQLKQLTSDLVPLEHSKENADLVPRWLACISGSIHRHRPFVLKHLDPREDRLRLHGRVVLLRVSGRGRLWNVHEGRRGGLGFGRGRGAAVRVHRNGVVLLRFVALVLGCWSLAVGRPLGGVVQ